MVVKVKEFKTYYESEINDWISSQTNIEIIDIKYNVILVNKFELLSCVLIIYNIRDKEDIEND